MKVVIKFLGTSGVDEDNITTNDDYIVLGFLENSSHFRAVIVDDNGSLYQTHQNVDNTAKWQLISAEVSSCDTII